jgi:NAD(P)H dehydrogenase (quinone)
MGDYFETEDRIRRSGLPHLLFRNALYLDTVPLYVGGAQVFESGIRLPAGDGRVAYALRREMGEALANAMMDHVGTDHTYVVAASRLHLPRCRRRPHRGVGQARRRHADQR